jgi:hypothetical protein
LASARSAASTTRYEVTMIGSFHLGLFLMLGSAHAEAGQQPQSATAAPQEEIVVKGEVPDADKRVCKSSVSTGSIMPKKVCKTKGEWEEIRERSLIALDKSKREKVARDMVQLLREQTK